MSPLSAEFLFKFLVNSSEEYYNFDILKKAFPKIIYSYQSAGRVFLIAGVALFMCACMMPADIKPFLNDDKVQEIITIGNTGAVITIDPPEIEDQKPELMINGTMVNEGGTVTVSDGDSVIVIVNNAAIYDTDTIWYCNSSSPLTAGLSATNKTNDTLTGTAGTDPPFNEPGVNRYVVSVEAEAGGIPYSSWFTLVIN